MIQTSPSNRFEDFLDFARNASGKNFLSQARGATDEHIGRLAALCRYPLPGLYVDYLHHFGVNDGGLGIGEDADTSIDWLLRFYTEQAQRSYDQVPDKTMIFALEALSGGRGLYYPSGQDPRAPLVVATWEGRRGRIIGESFRNFLYFGVIVDHYLPKINYLDISERRRVKCLHTDAQAVPALTEFARKLGFRSYWFCDDYQACLENDRLHLQIVNAEDGTNVFLVSRTREPPDQQITRAFQLAFDAIGGDHAQ